MLCCQQVPLQSRCRCLPCEVFFIHDLEVTFHFRKFYTFAPPTHVHLSQWSQRLVKRFFTIDLAKFFKIFLFAELVSHAVFNCHWLAALPDTLQVFNRVKSLLALVAPQRKMKIDNVLLFLRRNFVISAPEWELLSFAEITEVFFFLLLVRMRFAFMSNAAFRTAESFLAKTALYLKKNGGIDQNAVKRRLANVLTSLGIIIMVKSTQTS